SGSDQPGATGIQGTRGVPDPLNHPSPRAGAASWVDSTGSIWIFGGTASFGYENDLWRFEPTARVWTWMNGTDRTNLSVAPSPGVYTPPGTTNDNVPSSRAFAASWTDASGNFWLFGGDGQTDDFNSTGGLHNDLWKYTPGTNTWLWLSGSNAAGSPAVF